MRLQIISPLRMQWESYYKQVFPDAVWSEKSDFSDVDTVLHMWCDEDTVRDVNGRTARHIVFLRRYEWYAGFWKRIDWSLVDAVICVNDFLAEQFHAHTGIRAHVVYNGVDPSKWTYKERTHGNKIAWVGFVNQKKNIPLALQILAELPKDYELHVAGEIQDEATWDYMVSLTEVINRKVKYYGHIPHEAIDRWLDDKNYILSTAISEGCPNHVIEAMAKGIKPVVHDWPGAREQNEIWGFATVKDAVNWILPGTPYYSYGYRNMVEKRFGLSTYEKVREIVGNAGKLQPERV